MTCHMHGEIAGEVSDLRSGEAAHFAIRVVNERGEDVHLHFNTRAQALDFAMKLTFAILATPEDKGEKNDPQSK